MSLSCEINKEEFYAGETIKLKVGLNIEGEKKGKDIAGGFLKLIIKGEEFASVFSTDHAVQKHFDRIAHPLFTVDYDLDCFDEEGLEMGSYEYPFEHVLDDSLPGSFFVRNVKGYCTIRYMVDVILRMPSSSVEDIVFHLPFDVKAIPQESLENQTVNLLQPVIQQIRCCSCFTRGSISLGCALDKTVVSQFDTLTASFVVENNSTVDISEMKLSLYQRTEFRGRFTKATRRELMAEERFSAEDLLETGKKKKRSSKAFSPEEISESLISILSSDADSRKINCTFLIRPNLHSSYNGKRIKIYHQFELALVTSDIYSDATMQGNIKIIPLPPIESMNPDCRASILNPACRITASFNGELTSAECFTASSVEPYEESAPDRFIISRQSSTFEDSEMVDGILNSNTSQRIYPVTFDGIIEAIEDTHEDRQLIENFLTDSSKGYKKILNDLDHKQFGTIVAKVYFRIDQAQIAEMLARELGDKFTSKYVASACRLSDGTNRSDIVRETAKYVVDMKQNRHKIEKCLSPFDKVLISGVLDEASK